MKSINYKSVSVLFVLPLLFFFQNSYSQFTNSDLNGSWILELGSENHFISFDDMGNVIDMSAFGLDGSGNIGEYSLASTGELEGWVDFGDTLYISGALTSVTMGQAYFIITGDTVGDVPLHKVVDEQRANGDWTGLFTEDSTQVVISFSLDVTGNGNLVNSSGIPDPATGRLLSSGSFVVGHFDTPDTSGWSEVHFSGTLTGNTVTGRYTLDCNECPEGAFSMTRTPVSLNESHPESTSISLFPNPVSDILNIRLINLPSGIYQLSLFSVQGKKSLKDFSEEVSVSSKDIVIDTQGLAKGIYFLNIKGAGIDQNRKFLVD